MRNIILITSLILLQYSAQAQFKNADLQATGLTCALCSNVINKALLKLPFIESVKSDVKHSSFVIQFKAGETADPDAIRKAVEDAGFAVGKLSLNGQFNGEKAEYGKALNYAGSWFHFIGKEPGTLSGMQTLTILDKGFVTLKEYKKAATGDKLNCLQNGNAAHCPAANGLKGDTRIYHVSL